MAHLLRAVMFSILAGMFGGLFLSLVLGAFGVYSISYGSMAALVGIVWFGVELRLMKRRTSDNESND